MSNLILRADKGSALTFTEMDNNLKEASKGGLRNLILNGDFALSQEILYQRSLTDFVSFSAPTTKYIFDNWHLFDDGTGVCKIHQTPFTLAQTDVPGNPRYYLRYEQQVDPAQDSTERYIRFFVEDVLRIASREVTLSFWARSPTSSPITLAYAQNFGSGGSPTALTSGATIPIGTTWKRYTSTFTIASASGKTMGADNGQTNFRLNFPTTGLPIIDLANVQLELGNVATDFEQMLPDITLSWAQRYYECSLSGMGIGGSFTSSGSHMATLLDSPFLCANVQFAEAKRTPPAITLWSLAGTQGNMTSLLNNSGTSNDIPLNAVSQVGTGGFGWIQVSSGTAPKYGRFHWAADCRM